MTDFSKDQIVRTTKMKKKMCRILQLSKRKIFWPRSIKNNMLINTKLSLGLEKSSANNIKASLKFHLFWQEDWEKSWKIIVLLKRLLKHSQHYKKKVAFVRCQDRKQSKPIELHSQPERTIVTEQRIRNECRQLEHIEENNHRYGNRT